MAKGLEAQVVNPILTGFIEDIISTKGSLPFTKPFEAVPNPINEYDGRMRINATDKFDVSVYIATVNFYLNQADMQGHRNTKGAMVLYMDLEVADKIFKAAGMQVPYDEDDESMLALCGNLCQTIANALKDRLSASGYAGLVVSEQPGVFKNSIPAGVEFSRYQNEKQEISFFFLKHKALVIDWTMAPLPKK